MVLEIQNIDKSFGGIHALNDVSFSVQSGEIIGLVGDNGAGKSTLMKCVSGVVVPDSGDIYFEKKKIPLGQASLIRDHGIEMIYQDLALCPQQDVVSNIFLGREKMITIQGYQVPFLDRRTMKNRAQEILKKLNADIDLNSVVGDLSGGQQQAVAIARAMVDIPRLVIMDEPTAALGVKESRKVINLIKNLKKQNVTVIMISHHLPDVFETATRIVVMKHGSVDYDTSVTKTTLKAITERLLT